MSDYYYVVEVKNDEHAPKIQEHACYRFHCNGIEEFSIDEDQVDKLLGKKSYLSQNPSDEILNKVEQSLEPQGYKIYFTDNQATNNMQHFCQFLTSEFSNTIFEVKKYHVVDWNEKWKNEYSPIEISDDLVIIPAWEKDKNKHDCKFPIYINPGQGFGTGSHETTFLCLKLLLEIFNDDLPIHSCLDFGCGSGILGLAYQKIYPQYQTLDMYDIDPLATENSIENTNLNHANNAKILNTYKIEDINKIYQLVFANILYNTLISEKDQIIPKVEKNGFLILSGLLSDQYRDIVKIYEDTGRFKLIKEINKNNWHALLLKRN